MTKHNVSKIRYIHGVNSKIKISKVSRLKRDIHKSYDVCILRYTKFIDRLIYASHMLSDDGQP